MIVAMEKWNKVELELYSEKEEVLSAVNDWINELGFSVSETDFRKPWGAYWKIDDEQIMSFLETFFPDKLSELDSTESLSPKFLLVGPGERLSWQYHLRRSEDWRVLEGSVEVKSSIFDEEPEVGIHLSTGDSISFGCGERHRLIGANGWGLVAEIWTHTDKDSPSDEKDIVRLQDDYLRNK